MSAMYFVIIVSVKAITYYFLTVTKIEKKLVNVDN